MLLYHCDSGIKQTHLTGGDELSYFEQIGQTVLLASLFLIPISFYLHYRCINHIGTSILLFLLAAYLSGVYAVVGLPDLLYIRFNLRYNYIPFQYMFSAWKTSALNIALFFPLGLLVPLVFRRFRSIYQILLLGFFTSLGIEVLQIFTYRATDINDLITNSLGTVLGWAVAQILLWLFPKTQVYTNAISISHVLSAVFVIMFFLHPLAEQLFRIIL